MENTVRSIAV